MKKIFPKEAIIGVAVVASLVILYLGIEFLKGVNIFQPSNFYYVMLDDVTGIDVSSPVTINGYQVGLVRSIEYDYQSNGAMKVELNLDRQLRIPKGSRAEKAQTLLGVGSIDIKLTKGSEYYAAGDVLPGGIATGLMESVAAEVMPSVNDMLPKIDSIMTNINRLTASPALYSSIDRLDLITRNLEAMTRALNTSASSQLPPILSNANDVSHDLTVISADLKQLTAQLKGMPIDAAMANVNTTTANLANMTSKLNSRNSTLGLLINDRALYDHLNSTINDLDSILIDLKAHPKKYVNFKLL